MRRVPAPPPSLAAIESIILSAWCDVLGISTFGAHDRPFEAGATSASLIQVHYRIENQLNLTISPVMLFEHPTVAELARHLHQTLAPAEGTSPRDQPPSSDRLRARQNKRRMQGAAGRGDQGR
jgi:Phosphopantetheine attachment site